MIQERIQLGPRIIKGVTCEDEEAKEYIEATNFCIIGTLSTLLKQDFSTRILEGERTKEYPPPIVL